jgi:hypothetical protein
VDSAVRLLKPLTPTSVSKRQPPRPSLESAVRLLSVPTPTSVTLHKPGEPGEAAQRPHSHVRHLAQAEAELGESCEAAQRPHCHVRHVDTVEEDECRERRQRAFSAHS